MTKLPISKDLSLPLEVVTQTLAILARKGSGKTFTARRLMELLFKAGMQVVDVDPKGDHWGMRSSADGKGPGLGFLILGGEHGDLPLEAGAGELVAKLVVEERVSVILDLSLFRKHEVATFMTAFLEGLYRLKAREAYRTPVMLLVDEADAVAPQRPQHGEERMLGAIEDIVRRGRQRGIGCTLVTQRSAVLNKNVLTQAQVMIAMRTIAPQDLAAMDEWINVHGTREQRATLMESLPSLPRGDAWVWSPGWPTDAGIFQRIHVAPIETFDSGATPEPGQKRVEPKARADVDLEALRRQMAETVERTKANDPAALRRRVVDLERELAKGRKTLNATAAVAQAREKRVEVPVLKDGQAKRLEVAVAKLTASRDRLAAAQDRFTLELDRQRRAENEVAAAIGGLRAEFARVAGVRSAPPPRTAGPGLLGPEKLVRRAERVMSAPPSARGAPSDLDKAQRAILAVLAQYPDGCEAGKLTLLAGYRWSGGFRNALSALRTAGLIEGANGETMRITEAGRAALGDGYEPLPAGPDLVAYWLAHRSLGACERAVLQALVKHPAGLDAAALASATGYEWSGGFRNALSNLRTAGLLVGRNGETMRASEELFG